MSWVGWAVATALNAVLAAVSVYYARRSRQSATYTRIVVERLTRSTERTDRSLGTRAPRRPWPGPPGLPRDEEGRRGR